MIAIKLIVLLFLAVVLILDVLFAFILIKEFTLPALGDGAHSVRLTPLGRVMLPTLHIVCVTVAGLCGYWIYTLTQSLNLGAVLSLEDIAREAKNLYQDIQYVYQAIQRNSALILNIYFIVSLFITIFSFVSLVPFAWVILSAPDSGRGMARAAAAYITTVGITIAFVNSLVATTLAWYKNVDNAWVGPSMAIHGLLLAITLIFVASIILYMRLTD